MDSVFTPLKSAWRVVDVRKKIIASLLLLLVYRIGVAIPVPN